MSLLIMVLLLLVSLLISNVISHYIPYVPTALIQIVFGVMLALVFKDVSFGLDSEWFLLLFIAPLLYNDGRHFPREELWKMRAPIFGNAIFLVLFTTIGGGLFIHWLIEAIPLAEAFALAAILSPTDPVAVNGIAKRIRIPEKILSVVRGESLINDASGLVAFNYAVTAAVTGYFSLEKAVFDFSYIFIVGALSGLVTSLLITWIRYSLRKQGIGDVTFYSLVQILTPFIIYIATEELLGASGVIAVVVAGLLHAIASERTETIAAEEKVLTENIWSIVLFILNGIVFLLLGLNIPASMSATVENPTIGNWRAIGYVLAIGIIILSIRFIWSYLFTFYQYHFRKATEADKPSLKSSLSSSLTGVRGTVTMAGVLSLPLYLESGAIFPERSLILFLAAGVILFTLVMATVFLPLLSEEEAGTDEEESVKDASLVRAQQKVLLAAIQKIKQETNEENQMIALALMDEYKAMFKKMQPEKSALETKDYQKRITEIRLLGLKAERKYIQEAMQRKEIDQETFEILETSYDHREEILSLDIGSSVKHIIGSTIREWKRFKRRIKGNKEAAQKRMLIGREIQEKAILAAMEELEKQASKQKRAPIIRLVLLDYQKMLSRIRLNTRRYDETIEEKKDNLRIKVMDTERFEIHRLYEAGEISNEQARELRRFINYIENVTLYEYDE